MGEFIILIMCRQAQQRLKFCSISNKIVGILAGCDTYLAIIPWSKFRGLFIWLIGFFLLSRSAFFAQFQAALISACRKLKQGIGLGLKFSKNRISKEVKGPTLPWRTKDHGVELKFKYPSGLLVQVIKVTNLATLVFRYWTCTNHEGDIKTAWNLGFLETKLLKISFFVWDRF